MVDIGYCLNEANEVTAVTLVESKSYQRCLISFISQFKFNEKNKYTLFD